MIQTPSVDWWAIMPEVVLGVGMIVVLLTGLGASAWMRAVTVFLTLGALVAAAVIAVAGFDHARPGALSGQIDSDQLANLVRLLAASAGIATVIQALRRGRGTDDRDGEYYSLILAAVCGMGLLGAAGSLVSLFVGLELFSIALYVLCALEADRVTSLESGLKYLIVGGVSSAVLLYGSALVYGATGSFGLADIGHADGRGILLFTGLALVLIALAFKVSAAPVHWWTPDVYDGAPTTITGFMATATKAAAFAAVVRVLLIAFSPEASTWVPAIAALATLSIVVGNLGALVQQRVKRMLAYSSIAHAGYLLTALVGWRHTGVAALLYALIVYVAMTLGAFALVYARERQLGRPVTYSDFAGTGWSSGAAGWLGALPGMAMIVIMLSLAGIPPTAGFFAKFGIFDAAVSSGYAWLAAVGVVGSVVSLAYYLRLPFAMYLQDETSTHQAEGAEEALPGGSRTTVTLGVAFAAASLALAFIPGRALDAGCKARNSLLATGIGNATVSCSDRDSGGSVDAAAP